MKKIISLTLALFMFISLFSMSVFAESKTKLSLTGETVYAGEEFIVNLFISDNSKMSGAVIDVLYDNTMLEFISAEHGAILDENANINIKNTNGEKSRVRFTYLAPSSSVTAEGIIMSITFKAIETASGNTDLAISIPNSGDFVTQDLERIPYEIENSVVKVINTNNLENDETSSESSTEIVDDVTEKVSQSATEKLENNETDKTDNSEDDNKDDLLIISLLVVGVLFVGVGIVILAKGKKKK